MTATSTTIQSDANVVTLINVFDVPPERQREVVDALVEATEQIMRHRPGFVSANIHASDDGRRVINYAQWASKEAFEAMLADPVAQEHMAAIGRLVDAFDPRLYTVASVHHA